MEDVLVKVNELVFPADFYVIRMEEEGGPILLGRPFLRTARTKIVVFIGQLSMEFDGEIVTFDLTRAMKFSSEGGFVFSVDLLDNLSANSCQFSCNDPLEFVLSNALETVSADFDSILGAKLCAYVHYLEASPPFFKRVHVNYIGLEVPTTRLLPSIEQPPEVELKQLPSHLKYVFLGDGDTLPVIISSKLSNTQEEKLLRVLREHKTAIGWSIVDTTRISPDICMHRILLEEGAKPIRQP